jgi:hypothetical protein
MIDTRCQVKDANTFEVACAVFSGNQTLPFTTMLESSRLSLPGGEKSVHGRAIIKLLLIYFSFPPFFFSPHLEFHINPFKK